MKGNRAFKRISDNEFDELLSNSNRIHSGTHWSPVSVIDKALQMLELGEGSHVLDIGSGVGKFCAIGAMSTEAKFTGVEIRSSLVDEAQRIQTELGLSGITYLKDNVTTIDFSEFNAFYYYNPFCEQIAIEGWIDAQIEFSSENHRAYEAYVFAQFERLPIGTRIVTYYAQRFIFPNNYFLQELTEANQLALWVKIR